MNKLLLKVTCTVATLTALTATTMAAEATVMAGSSLRLRADSNTSSTILATMPNLASVEVTAVTEGGWYAVEYNGHSGFASAEYIELTNSEKSDLPVVADTQYGVINAGPLNVRKGPGTNTEVVKIFTAGTVLTITDDSEDGWYEIDGGYVSAQYVDIVTAEEAVKLKATATASSGSSTTGSALADFALKFKGYPYVYGGTTPSGFDCSGFVQYVCKNFGISINRGATSQYQNGTYVSYNNLQAGDLVFFSKSGSGITHVGMYIGNGQFIHASTPSVGVIVSNMNSAYYTSGFVGGRRVV